MLDNKGGFSGFAGETGEGQSPVYHPREVGLLK
jgi:hypothetical protein